MRKIVLYTHKSPTIFMKFVGFEGGGGFVHQGFASGLHGPHLGTFVPRDTSTPFAPPAKFLATPLITTEGKGD